MELGHWVTGSTGSPGRWIPGSLGRWVTKCDTIPSLLPRRLRDSSYGTSVCAVYLKQAFLFSEY